MIVTFFIGAVVGIGIGTWLGVRYNLYFRAIYDGLKSIFKPGP